MKDPKVGTGKKPKGSGRRLYTDENPKDTVGIKFATPADARATVAKVKNHRNVKYNEWKKIGIKWDINHQDPYQMYLDNEKCSLCNKQYKNTSDKQLDHDHLSGHIRGFVCRGCNSRMSRYDNLRIRLCLELHRFYLNK